MCRKILSADVENWYMIYEQTILREAKIKNLEKHKHLKTSLVVQQTIVVTQELI